MSALRARGVARKSAVFAAVLALSATTCFTAYAQEDPATPTTSVTEPSTPAETTTPTETTPPTETTSPTQTSTPVETSESVAPPTEEKPADEVAEKPADKPVEQPQNDPATKSDIKATATVGAAPPVVGQTVPVELTITNSGPAEATGVSARLDHISGSYYTLNSDEWDGLQPPWGSPSTVKLAPGESRTFHLNGRFYNYQGTSRFTLRATATNDVNPSDGGATVEIAVREPVKQGKISGILWGDANGNGTHDAGEGLAGAEAYLYGGGNPNETPRTRTDANGRFTFTDLELRAWGLSFQNLPGGWIVAYNSELIPVVGGDTTSELRYQAVRPLEDQLSASVRFLTTDHVDGGPVSLEFTLTNRGGADISGVVAGCGRSGEGPHINVWGGLGELSYDRGTTIPAGQSRVFAVAGQVSVNASDYGYSYVACDFGPRDGLVHGYPTVFDYVKVGEKRTNTNGSIYVDRNGNGWKDAEGEHLNGVSFSLVDPKTGVVAGTASGSGEEGQAYFTDIPTGLYKVVVNGPWKVESEWLVSAADCSRWCQTGWAVEVVPTEEPGGEAPGGAQPQPEQVRTPVILPASNYTATAGALAETGASVGGLGLVGALTLLVGGASVFLARRRTA
ncbi:hypothetical protein [Lentzea sp. CC55]|uniref:hypothetical protein n=1 Tax=Lentzea sp. CC55 TaxID=2884909 RepID=UPI001F1CEAFA|nr:hypothetical protein [Lentzea sp. CC55]MCG8920932.1 hypothetical protein [Lentzea sp. CC55]